MMATKENAGSTFIVGERLHRTTVRRREQKAYLMPIVGYVSKVCFCYAVGETADTDLASVAWKRAKRTRQRPCLAIEGLIVHHDWDSVYTGHAWINRLTADGARLSYSLNGARGNTAMESFNGRFKDDLKGLTLECETLEDMRQVVVKQIRYYNIKRRHSSCNYVSPMVYLKEWRKKARGGGVVLINP